MKLVGSKPFAPTEPAIVSASVDARNALKVKCFMIERGKQLRKGVRERRIGA